MTTATEDESMFDTIVDLKHRQPFVAFAIVMTSADRYLVEKTDELAVGGSQLHFYPGRTDRGVHLRLNQIAALDQVGESQSA